MIASALRPLMSALRLRSKRRRLSRQQIIKLLADADRRADPARRARPTAPSEHARE